MSQSRRSRSHEPVEEQPRSINVETLKTERSSAYSHTRRGAGPLSTRESKEQTPMFVPNDSPTRNTGKFAVEPREFEMIQVPKTSLDPSDAVEKELRQR